MLQHRVGQEFCLGPPALKEALISSDASLRDLYTCTYSDAERRFLSEAYNPKRVLFQTLLIRTAFDWIVSRPEEPQDFESFYNSTRWRRCNSYRRKIYLQPIDDDEQREGTGILFMDDLKSYLEAFFLGFHVMSLPSISTSSMKCSFRQQGHSRKVQLHTDAILRHLQRVKPRDAFCILGLTFIDLYPCDTWNYTFGKSAYELAVGVCSFSRLSGERSATAEQGVAMMEEAGDSHDSRARPPTPRALTLTEILQCCKVVSHEVCHLLGLWNCRWLRCVMQGVSSLDEALLRPMDLCPICLRKLHCVLEISLLQRYRKLQTWCHRERARMSLEKDYNISRPDSDVVCERTYPPVSAAPECNNLGESVSKSSFQGGGLGTGTCNCPIVSNRARKEGPVAESKAMLSTEGEEPSSLFGVGLSIQGEGPTAAVRVELSTQEQRLSVSSLSTDLLGGYEAWLDACIKVLQGEASEDELSQLDLLVDAMPAPRNCPARLSSPRVSLEVPREEQGWRSVIGQKFSQLWRKLRSRQLRTDHSLDDSED